MGKRRTEEEVRNILLEYEYELIEDYTNEKSERIVIIKDKNGFKYKLQLASILNGYKPSIAHIENPFSLENISLWLKINNDNIFLMENNLYSGYYDNLNLYCKVCDDFFTSNWLQIKRKPVCLVCIGKQAGTKNNLAVKYPKIASEWNHDYNKENPEEFTVSSHKKAYWTCSECGYGKNGEWCSQIKNRTNGNNCPACSKPPRVVTDKNRLSILYPHIAAEWHPIKNEGLNIENFSYGSNKKVWWLCPNGHEYFSAPYSRVAGRNCKKCSDTQKESKIANELKSYILNKYDAKEEYSIFKNPDTNHYLPFDIYIFGGNNPKINGVYIEIHGSQHFRISGWSLQKSRKNGTTPEEELEYQKHKDKLKRKFAKKNGTYIEIDLRKIKEAEVAIELVEKIMKKTLSELR